MKRWTIATPAVVAVLAVWILTGCSSGSSGSPAMSSPAAATTGTIPGDVSIPMPPGKYGTVQFRPPFTFSTTVTSGGGADVPDFANFSLKSYGNDYFASFAFLRFAKVCDPNAPGRLTASPKQLINCLIHNPHLRVTAKPAPVTIGGIWIFDVHGTTVAVAWSDLTAHFAANLAAAEKIMQTVRFS